MRTGLHLSQTEESQAEAVCAAFWSMKIKIISFFISGFVINIALISHLKKFQFCIVCIKRSINICIQLEKGFFQVYKCVVFLLGENLNVKCIFFFGSKINSD